MERDIMICPFIQTSGPQPHCLNNDCQLFDKETSSCLVGRPPSPHVPTLADKASQSFDRSYKHMIKQFQEHPDLLIPKGISPEEFMLMKLKSMHFVGLCDGYQMKENEP